MRSYQDLVLEARAIATGNYECTCLMCDMVRGWTNDMPQPEPGLPDELWKASRAVYGAAEESVADDLSRLLSSARSEIERLASLVEDWKGRHEVVVGRYNQCWEENGRLVDDLAEVAHPEFGSMWMAFRDVARVRTALQQIVDHCTCEACGGGGSITAVEYVTHDMALDAGEPSMEGQPQYGEVPCPACSGNGLLDLSGVIALEALSKTEEYAEYE